MASDGLSNVIALVEVAGRQHTPIANIAPGVNGSRFANAVPDPELAFLTRGADPTQGCGGGSLRCPNRWADPDSAIGVSGGATTNAVINNNRTPLGGPSSCLWISVNCGMNDEMYSFHLGGCHVLLSDGSVRFISENLDAQTLRRLVTRNDGEVLGEF